MNKDNNAIITHRIIERDGYKIFVGSFTNPAFVNKNRHNELQQFNPKELVPEEASKCDLRILVIHDIWENIVGRAKYFTNVDIIICANLKQHFPSPMKSGSTLILSAGDGGKYLGNLVMRFDENRKLIYTENHLIALLQETGTDTTIKNEIDKISSKIDLQAQGTDQNVVRGNSDGIFTFLSDRDGKTGLYLKMIGKNAEYPLTRQLDEINKPVISFAADRLAFFSKSPQGYGKLMTTDLTGSRSIIVKDSCYLHDAIFSPDGKWLYYAAQCDNKKNSDIMKVRVEGGPPQPVIAWDNSSEHSINFSSDNAYMLFCTDRDGPSQIYLTNPSGDRPLRITDENASHVSPVFSPDCQKIAYLTDRSNFGGKLDLWVYDRLSGTHNQITQNSNVKAYCWLSDSKTIVYSSGVNILDLNKVDIILFRFSKLTSNNMLKTYNEKMPTTITLDGKEIVIFERESDTGEKQIFQINPDGTGERCIINSDGNDWLGE
jgi:Tol biopolymer transport system component